MKIDNAHLSAFATVLREGSFEAAAKRLHVTPSAISQRVKQLEAHLGQVLLQRSTPTQATSAGMVLARHAEQVAMLEAEMLSEVGAPEMLGGATQRVPIAVNVDSLETWFLQVFELLPPGLPVCLDIRVEDQDHSAILLREGTVMGAVSSSAEPIHGCTAEPLGVMRYMAVASPGFAQTYFATGDREEALHRAPMLGFNRKDRLHDLFVAQRPNTAQLSPTHYIPSVRGFVHAVKRGLGWGLAPEALVAEGIAAGELLDILPSLHLDVALYWHRWRMRSAFLDLIGAALKQAVQTGLRV
ncbi:LysR family transcriptional regulator, chromosome initiation inhibitor [Rhodoferax sp. OV413]|uniref:LysR family transcriptional regulator ArgP n=1 Tax=Rhodoferax sp. OV413 TaxID=1855285 RepID=UPI000882D2EE|nr:LysR family transcriptional regulator ArgP [Rhodoferax sp. OV413]SDP53428.1 LysR family transcriptional regulator, chromosome initiation inhibitor [Rhodoferax sp. OV413]